MGSRSEQKRCRYRKKLDWGQCFERKEMVISDHLFKSKNDSEGEELQLVLLQSAAIFNGIPVHTYVYAFYSQ